jgi:hypothetical protein
VAFRDKNSALLAAQQAAQEVEIRMLREQLVEKREEIVELKVTLARTQDALIAKEAPEAYRDHIIEREQAVDENLTPEQQSAIEINRIESRAAEELIANMEGPLFKGAEDMISMLSAPTGPPATESLHGDGES